MGFPGGRVDDTDSFFPVRGEVAGVENAVGVAAIREAFEEAGLWLGEGEPTTELRDALNNRTGKLPLDGSLTADLNQIRQWSWWITPDTEPKRYDTRFFVCVVPYEPDVDIIPDASETVEARWLTPTEAIRLHEEVTIYGTTDVFDTIRYV